MGELHDRLREDYGRIDPQLPQTAVAPVECAAASCARHGGNRADGRATAANPRRSAGAHLDRAERIHARAGSEMVKRIYGE